MKPLRNHWRVENELHWTLDVSFNEDHCRVSGLRRANMFILLTIDIFRFQDRCHACLGQACSIRIMPTQTDVDMAPNVCFIRGEMENINWDQYKTNFMRLPWGWGG